MTTIAMPTEAELEALRKLDDRRKATLFHFLLGALLARAQMASVEPDVDYARELLAWLTKEAKQ